MIVGVPYRSDVVDLDAPPTATCSCPRGRLWALPEAGPARIALLEVDVQEEIVWQVPSSAGGDVYAWLAGEAAVIRTTWSPSGAWTAARSRSWATGASAPRSAPA